MEEEEADERRARERCIAQNRLSVSTVVKKRPVRRREEKTWLKVEVQCEELQTMHVILTVLTDHVNDLDRNLSRDLVQDIKSSPFVGPRGSGCGDDYRTEDYVFVARARR